MLKKLMVLLTVVAVGAFTASSITGCGGKTDKTKTTPKTKT